MQHISDLRPDSRNARKHNARNIGLIEKALNEVGAARSIVVDEDGVVLAGNGLLEAAAAAGIHRVQVVDGDGETIIAVRRSNLTPEQKQRLALFDNRAAELADWDTDVLAEMVDAGDDLSGLWTDDELAALLDDGEPGVTEGLTDPDDVPEPPADPVTKPGDLWLLGDHRLLCGDSTVITDVERLMAGERAQVTITDPPYNVGIDYGATTDDQRRDYAQFCRDWFVLCPSDGTVFTPGTVNMAVWFGIEPPKWVCAWRKANQCSSSPLNGWNTWEPLLVYGKHPKPVGHDSWDIPVALHDPDIGHPVPKTMAAWSTFVEAFSTTGSLIYDPFLGSGTTLLCAESLARTCYGLEISPAYCDVIVERWESLTGGQARREAAA